jgi:hypothetical protein
MPAMLRLALYVGCFLAASALGAGAGELPKPSGPVVLTITGAITNTNGPGKAEFDRAMLEGLGLETLRTSTPWTEGVVAFEGVPMARLLDTVGATGSWLHTIAINDYAVDLEAAEMRRYEVLMAMRQDGKPLRVRDRGPLWVVYPREQHAELMDAAHNNKWIWQVREIEVR